jgi:WD40 repeat protein
VAVTAFLLALATARADIRLLPDFGFSDYVETVRFDPTGRFVVGASCDGQFAAFDAGSGSVLFSMDTGHQIGRLPYEPYNGPKRAPGLSFSGDGRLIATAAFDGPARLWDAHTGRWIKNLWNRTDRTSFVSLSPNGAKAVTGATNAPVLTEWDVRTGKPLHSLSVAGGTKPVAASFAPKGDRLAVLSENGTLDVWSESTRTKRSEFHGGTGSGRSVAFSWDGKRVAAASGIEIDVWDLPTGVKTTTIREKVVPEGTSVFSSVAFSPDGAHLLTCTGTADLWNSRTGAHELSLGPRMVADDAAYSPGGDRIVTAEGFRMSLGVYDKGGSRLGTFAGDTAGLVAASITGRGFRAVGRTGWNDGGSAWVFSFLSAKSSVRIDPSDSETPLWSAAFSDDGSKVATGSAEGDVWETDTGRRIASVTPPERNRRVWRVAISHDGATLATGSMNQFVHLWDIGSGKLLQTLVRSLDVEPGAFSSNDSELATPTAWGYTLIWNLKTGAIEQQIGNKGPFDQHVEFSPDSRRLLLSGLSEKPRIFVVGSNGAPLELEGSKSFIWASSFSRDGSQVVGVSNDGAAYVWNTETGACLRSFVSPGPTIAAGFTPSGRVIWMALRSGRIELVDSATLERIGTITVYDDGGWVAMTPDCRFDSDAGPSSIHVHAVVPSALGARVVVEAPFVTNRFTAGLVQQLTR